MRTQIGRYFNVDFLRYSLRINLELPNGIPSHDTIRRVLSLVDPLALESFLRRWANEYVASRSRRMMIDGKSIRGTEIDISRGKRPLHLLNVFDPEHGIVLAQTKANGSGILVVGRLRMKATFFSQKNMVMAEMSVENAQQVTPKTF